jgi:hypothetical protein
MSNLSKLSAQIEAETGRTFDSYLHTIFLYGSALFDVSDYVEKYSSKKWSGMSLVNGEVYSSLDFRLEDFNQRDKIIWLADDGFLFLVLPEDDLAIQMLDDINVMIDTKEPNIISQQEFQSAIHEIKKSNDDNVRYASVLEELEQLGSSVG